jgi:hypothetical protein
MSKTVLSSQGEWIWAWPQLLRVVIKTLTAVHTYNSSYSGSRDQEDHSSKPTPGKQFMTPYLKKTHHKNRAGGVAPVVEWLPSKYEALSSNPSKNTCLQSITLCLLPSNHKNVIILRNNLRIFFSLDQNFQEFCRHDNSQEINLKLFFFCSIGVWTQRLMLTRQVLYGLSHSVSPNSQEIIANHKLKWITQRHIVLRAQLQTLLQTFHLFFLQ